jgi:hypothetical protein
MAKIETKEREREESNKIIINICLDKEKKKK